MSFLLDTNVISEIRKGDRANAAVRAWWETVRPEEVYLSVLVVGEIRRGIERLMRRDPAQAAVLDGWCRGLIEGFGDRILPIELAAAETWGRMGADGPLPVVDGLLAACAKTHDLTLVTRNAADVARSGARVLNPFSASSEGAP